MLTPPQLPAQPPTQETLDAIVAALPPPRVVAASTRPLLVFVDGGGGGASALAKRVAQAANCELLSPDAVIAATIFSSISDESPKESTESTDDDQRVADENSNNNNNNNNNNTKVTLNSFEKGVFEALLAGKHIDSDKFLDGYKAMAASNDAQHKGIVIDGLPFTSPCDDNEIVAAAEDDLVASSTPTYKYKDLETLAAILDKKPHNFRLVLVHLTMGEHDLKARRQKQWVDPVTGLLYPGGQVDYSKRRRAQGWVDGTLDEENEAALVEEDRTWDFDVHDDVPKKKFGSDDDDGGGDGDDEEDGGGGEEEELEDDDLEDGDDDEEGGGSGRKKKKSKAAVNVARFNLSNKNTWQILPKEILDRLLKRPEDLPECLTHELKKYKEKSIEITKLTTNYFDPLHTIKLDASQHPDILFKSAINRLTSLGFNLLETPPMSKKLDISPGTFTGMTQSDIYTYLNALELEAGEPPREESSWGRFCPVQFYEHQRLVHNGFETPVSYRGFFFFLSDAECLGKFVANPDKYLETAPSLQGVKMCVLGGPFTGKTAQSKMIAKIYNLKFISVDDILEAWDQDPNQAELKKRVPMYADIVKRCKKGQSVAPETMIELIKMALNGEVKTSKPNTPVAAAADGGGGGGGGKHGGDVPPKSGWIIDGFPRTLDEARALLQADLIPEYVVLLKNDINEERVRMRLKIHTSDSKSGKPWDEKSNAFRSTPISLQTQYLSNPKLGSTAKLESHARLSSDARLGSPSTAASNTAAGRLTSPLATAPGGKGATSSASHSSSSPAKSLKSSPIKPTPPTTRGAAATTVKSSHGARSYSRASQRKSTNQRPTGGGSGATNSASNQKPMHITYYMPSLPITTYPYFDNLFNGFREELPEIIKLLELKTKIVETGAEQAIPTILAIIQTAIDPFLPKAYEISEKQLQENPAPFEQGSTKDFCPFALRQVNILQKGNPQIAVRYMGQMYNLSSEDAKYAFLMEPHNFVSVRHLMTPPPPRFFFLGPTGSGKSVCMKALEKWGAPIIRFADYVYEFAATAEQSVREEIEYMMKENAGLLSPVLVEDVVTSLFKKEPYASKGFLLEGFPRSKAEAEVVVKHNLHIDAVVVLRIEPDIAAHRILTEKKKDWKMKRDEARRILFSSPDNSKAAAQLKLAEAELKKMDDQESEMYDACLDSVDKENLRIGDVLGTFETAWQVPIIEIDCNKCIRPVVGSLRRNCTQFCEYRKSILSNAYRIEYREAELLMRLGIKTYSPFGNICPVSLKKNSSVLKRLTGTKPVVYRTHIYYLRTEEARDEFIANLHEYITQPPPQPVVRPQICILGRPKSGKSVTAARIAKEYDMVHLTIPIIINSLINGKEDLELSRKISACLSAGLALPEDLVNEAVLLVTSRAVCLARGWVLDGYPQTVGQAKELERMGLIPHIVFELNISEEEMYIRSKNDVKTDVRMKTPHLNFAPIMSIRDQIHSDNVAGLKRLYGRKYANWIEIDGSKSKWFLKQELVVHLEAETMRRQNYTDLKTKGLAAPVHDIGISLEHIHENLSKFAEYCPVSLLDNGQLEQGPSDTSFTAEFEGKFYKMVRKEQLDVFLESPEKYAFGPDLPESLPEKKTSSVLVFPRQLELQGYCPVTLAEGPPGFESIIPGNPNHIVEYEGKLFAFTCQENQDKFMKTPWDYINLELPAKLPPKIVQINVGQLPLLGYLEQSVARALTEALTDVGKVRPKHPYKSLSKSAADYLGLYLKANNPKNKEWVQKKYSKELRKFIDRCQLISDISEMVRVYDSEHPFAFVPIHERQLGLDEKINLFFNLQTLRQQ